MSEYLTHFTKSGETLIHILRERKLKGSTTDSGFIVGDKSAVCFQDGSTYGLAQNLLHEQIIRKETNGKIRYLPYGISFSKFYLFEKGARPVLYEQTEKAKEILPKEEWWRIVNLNLTNKENIIDWTHEREWRIPGDMDFDISEVFIYLTNESAYRTFINDCPLNVYKEIKGIIVLRPILD